MDFKTIGKKKGTNSQGAKRRDTFAGANQGLITAHGPCRRDLPNKARPVRCMTSSTTPSTTMTSFPRPWDVIVTSSRTTVFRGRAPQEFRMPPKSAPQKVFSKSTREQLWGADPKTSQNSWSTTPEFFPPSATDPAPKVVPSPFFPLAAATTTAQVPQSPDYNDQNPEMRTGNCNSSEPYERSEGRVSVQSIGDSLQPKCHSHLTITTNIQK